MSTLPDNYGEMERQLADLTERAADLKRNMREGRIYELVANGERMIVRPVMVEQPKAGGERDPWFGLTYTDWRKFRQEGFDGWMETTPGSGAPKIMIMVDKAAQWFEARCRKQAAERGDGGMNAQSRRMRAIRKAKPQPAHA